MPTGYNDGELNAPQPLEGLTHQSCSPCAGLSESRHTGKRHNWQEGSAGFATWPLKKETCEERLSGARAVEFGSALGSRGRALLVIARPDTRRLGLLSSGPRGFGKLVIGRAVDDFAHAIPVFS